MPTKFSPSERLLHVPVFLGGIAFLIIQFFSNDSILFTTQCNSMLFAQFDDFDAIQCFPQNSMLALPGAALTPTDKGLGLPHRRHFSPPSKDHSKLCYFFVTFTFTCFCYFFVNFFVTFFTSFQGSFKIVLLYKSQLCQDLISYQAPLTKCCNFRILNV